jgi:L-ascorbate 6-phosphate lactonase
MTHVGYLVSVAGGPTIYFTGDTAYDEILSITVRPYAPEAMFCVINGGFRNMGPADAARLARQLNVKVTVPTHFELFPDNSQPPHMLLTNLKNEGIGETYRLLDRGAPYTYPE